MNKIITSLVLVTGIVLAIPTSLLAKNPHVATLNLSSKSFIWSGPPALSHYTVEFCDGTSTSKIDIYGKEEEESEFEYDKKIAKVTAKGGQQVETKEQSCEQEVKGDADEQENGDEDTGSTSNNEDKNDDGDNKDNNTNDDPKDEDISKGGPGDDIISANTLADTGNSSIYIALLALTGIGLISLSLYWIKNERN